MSAIIKNNKKLLYPALLWFIVFFLLPLAIIFIYSFTTDYLFQGSRVSFTFSNFLEIFQKRHYLIVLTRSLKISTLTTVFSILFSYPVSYFLAKKTRHDRILIVLLMIPFWINYLVRIFAWKLLLSENGVINQVLLWSRIINEPFKILYTQTAVIMGLVYTYTPMMILPLYATIKKIDDSLIEASRDLGASRVRAFFDITFKLSLTGIFSGTLLVFIPALGSFAIPAILGGTDSMMIGNLVENQFFHTGNWNFGSAFTLTLAVLSIALILFYSRLFGVEAIYKSREY
ncbi:MAG: Spermidine/putrescine transport system permease protein PotB [Actinobacteria bacterium ADurb.Bin346]|nr:MAG: Spermidine/putrescine transport system permease protein PotB [Actinobacteria bacterium ADurb.Bin346]